MDLELVETSELVAELERRFDHLVIAGLIDRDEKQYAVFAIWKSNAYACSGLAQKIGTKALSDWSEASEDAEPGGV